MLRIVCDPSSVSTELCLTEITLSGSQIFFMCLVGVWQRNFEPAVCVHVSVTRSSKCPLYFRFHHRVQNALLSPSISITISAHFFGTKYS